MVRRGLIAATLLCACEDEPRGLTAQDVHDIQLEVGDAEGYAWTGVYTAAIVPIDCPCEQTPLPELSYCSAAMLYPNQQITESIEVVHTDGTLLMRARGVTYFGPAWSDGSFVVGEAVNLSSAITDGYRVGLFEGTIDQSADFAARIEGTIRVRTAGKIFVISGADGVDPSAGGFGELSGDVDCTETVEISAVRTSD